MMTRHANSRPNGALAQGYPLEVHNLDGGGQLTDVLDIGHAMTIDPGRRKLERDATDFMKEKASG